MKDNRMVFSYTYETGDKSADLLMENATMLTDFVEEDTDRIIPATEGGYPSLSIYDGEGLETDDSEKISLLVNMEREIKDFDRRIAATRNCELHESEVHVRIVNSNGLDEEASRTLYTLLGLCVAEDGDEVSWYDYVWSHRFRDIDGAGLARRVAEKALSFLGGEQIRTGRYDGILTPQASADMLDILSESFLGESLFKNKTRLKGKEGTGCFSEKLTIIDSGMKGTGSFPFDGEGMPSKETVVVEKGLFGGFLYESYYGRKMGRPSTGNAVRGSIREAPHNSPRGIFIQPGTEDILKGFCDGVVIEELMGTHTANTITGDFSLGALGHLYEEGKARPFKGVIFSGNIFDILGSVDAVGDDLRFYGSVGSPSIFVRGLKISGI